MIVTLTLNPALDKSTELDRMIPEKKMRCAELKTEAGGGGINISKAIKALGGEALALFPSGGMNGKKIESLLYDKGIPFQTIPIPGETRENFVARELSTNNQFRFVMPGAGMQAEDLNHCRKVLEDLSGKISYLVMSGSLPPGVPETFPAELALLAKEKGFRFIADTSGRPLLKALEQGVYLLKPNLTELGSLVGKSWLDIPEIETAAEKVLNESRCEVIVVSMGPAGALLVSKKQKKKFNAPAVKKQSTVGAGDSMVAGIVYQLQKGADIETAVRYGVACGSAATINKGTQLFLKEDVEKLYAWMLQNP
ncbi:MAG: 1-phosphofructokinase family hexose kinase [Flavisolibacter sp.]